MTRPQPKPRCPLRTEAEVTQEVLGALRLFGLTAVRQNVGGMINPGGQYVAFGQSGDADFRIQLPECGGVPPRTLYLELKREGFDPTRLRGKAKERFARQLAKLREANARGDCGFWSDNAPAVIEALKVLLDGGTVEESEDGELRLVLRRETDAT